MNTNEELAKIAERLKKIAITKQINKTELSEAIRDLAKIKAQLVIEEAKIYVSSVDNLMQSLDRIVRQPDANSIDMIAVNAESAETTARCLRISNIAKGIKKAA